MYKINATREINDEHDDDDDKICRINHRVCVYKNIIDVTQ